MKLVKDSNLGKINIEIPINQGDIILHGNTEYIINRFVIVENKIFAVNTYSGLWVEINNLKFVKESKNSKYYKEIES